MDEQENTEVKFNWAQCKNKESGAGRSDPNGHECNFSLGWMDDVMPSCSKENKGYCQCYSLRPIFENAISNQSHQMPGPKI